MTCKKGGYVILSLRHNSLRDLFAEILEEVCSDVQIEPPLLPLTGEKLPHGSNTTPGARLDFSARNLWSPLAKAFIDVRIFNPQAKTNWDRSIPQMYTSHENEKKTEYLPRVLQVEKATFTPAVLSTSGGIGKEADKLIRRMAERMSAKRGETYSSVVSFHQFFYQLSTVTFPDYLEMVDITDLNDTRLRKKVAPPKYLGAKIESNLGELRASKLDSLSMKCKLSGLKKVFENSFFVRTYSLWNRLPHSIRTISEPDEFKILLVEIMWPWALEKLELGLAHDVT